MKTKFKDFTKGKLTAEEVMEQIEKDYTAMDICQNLDDEIMNWVDSDWEDDGEYDSEYDWYIDHNNKEAEDAVFDNMLREYGLAYEDFAEDQYEELKEMVGDYASIMFT